MENKYDKQFDNLDPHKVLSTLLKLLGNSGKFPVCLYVRKKRQRKSHCANSD